MFDERRAESELNAYMEIRAVTLYIKWNETGTYPVITPVLTIPPGLPSSSQMYPDAQINAATAIDNIIVIRLILLIITRRDCSSRILCGEKAKLTRNQDEQLYDEATGLVRAIMDLRDLEEGKIKMADFDEIALRDKLEDARRWVKYMKQMKE